MPPPPADYLHRETYIVWTSQNPEPPPPYFIERVAIRFTPSASSISLSSSNGGDTLKMGPFVPVYYDIVCGESLPSLYCEKRDSIIVTGEHKVDTGEELVYNLPHLKPSRHYLVEVKVWAPESTKEVFTLDGVETDTILLDPTKSQNLACFIPESLYTDRFVELRIKGPHDAYLENLKLYQIDIIDKSDKPSPGIVSFSSSPTLAVSINPTIGFPVKIRYQTSGRGLLTLEVYDATGRLVRVLKRTHCLQPIACHIIWKGDDDKGKPLPSGIYFVKLKSGGSTLTKKVVIIK